MITTLIHTWKRKSIHYKMSLKTDAHIKVRLSRLSAIVICIVLCHACVLCVVFLEKRESRRRLIVKSISCSDSTCNGLANQLWKMVSHHLCLLIRGINTCSANVSFISSFFFTSRNRWVEPVQLSDASQTFFSRARSGWKGSNGRR